MEKGKTPCMLLMNDLHISKDNIHEFKANWNEAESLCLSRNIMEIAIGGDLFLSRVSQTLDVLLTVHDMLLQTADKGIRITMAEGNHDLVDQESLRGYCHIFDQHPGVTVVDDFLTLEGTGWDFVLHMMSYFPETGSFTGRLQALVAGGLVSGKLNYLYAHQGINGALVQPAADELPSHIFECFDKVFVGHYHNRAKVKGTQIEYIGSSRQFNFGEDVFKGYTVLYNDGSYEFVQNKINARYEVVDVQAAAVNTHLLDRVDDIRSDSRYRVKVRIHGTQEEVAAIDKRKLLDAGANKVEIIAEDAEVIHLPESDMLEKFDNRKIRESYEEFCAKKQIDNVSLGLDYLSKIDAVCGV